MVIVECEAQKDMKGLARAYFYHFKCTRVDAGRETDLRKQFPGLLPRAAGEISDVYDWMVKV